MRRVMAGFTLIEALIALLVLTIGLLGAAGMLLTSVRNSHNSYLRSQASFIADSLVERMRANPMAIWGGQYNGVLNSSTPAAPTCGASGCTPAQVAGFDRAAIARQVAQHLPLGTGRVTCATTGAAPVRNFGISPVNGQCTITMSWNEKRDVDAAGFSGTQSFQLVVQP
ncbi:MAG TPA: type IV pilus modification protein PilV [Patescibacteria group bacterium]|nr:type IV pilus modification protein PilV [Patescibacteria group bacterium]